MKMLMLEFEGKALLRQVGIPVPPGAVRYRGQANVLPPAFPVAVKAQVASGGRGKQGGVVKANDPAQLESAAAEIFGLRFDGEAPECLLIEKWLDRKRELYLAVTVEGSAGGYVVLYGARGGVDVEAGTPLMRYDIGSPRAFRGYRLRKALAGFEDDAVLVERLIAVVRQMLRLAVAQDCLTVEINPLAVMADGSIVAADAKIVRDTAAAFRSSDIERLIERDKGRMTPELRRCIDASLMVVPLEGRVGLISGGAGMTMAVIDLLSLAGEKPAFFLDCSSNPTPEGYRLAFDLLDGDPKVGSILVSIFGGATHMDRVARVMVDILRERTSRKPVVLRLDGTHGKVASEILEAAGLANQESIEAAVQKCVKAVRGLH